MSHFRGNVGHFSKDFYDKENLNGRETVFEPFGDGGRSKVIVKDLPGWGTNHRCETCGEILDSVTSLVRHSVKMHADRSLHCGDCVSDFQSKLELVRHKRLFCEKISQKLRHKRVTEEIKRMTDAKEIKRHKKLEKLMLLAQQKEKQRVKNEKRSRKAFSSTSESDSSGPYSSEPQLFSQSKQGSARNLRQLKSTSEESEEPESIVIESDSSVMEVDGPLVKIAEENKPEKSENKPHTERSPRKTPKSEKPKSPTKSLKSPMKSPLKDKQKTPMKNPKQTSIASFFTKKS